MEQVKKIVVSIQVDAGITVLFIFNQSIQYQFHKAKNCRYLEI